MTATPNQRKSDRWSYRIVQAIKDLSAVFGFIAVCTAVGVFAGYTTAKQPQDVLPAHTPTKGKGK